MIEDNSYIENSPDNNLEHSDNSLELSDSQREYIGELDAAPQEWKGMSKDDMLERGRDVQSRLEELGISDIESQDKVLRDSVSPEFLGSFREYAYNQKMESSSNLENSKELSLDEVKEQCPEMYETVQLMNKRLANQDPDGIMNTLHYYRTEEGDFVLKSDHPEYNNTEMVVSDHVIYAETGCNVNGGQYSNYFNECINNERGIANTSYFIDGRSVYEHDELGRLVKETTVYNGEFNEKVERGTEYQNIIKNSKDGIEGDESSHSVPHSLGGSNESINQVPVKAEINHGSGSEWRANEMQVEDAVTNGITAYVEHTYRYEGSSNRPESLTCSTKIEQEQQTKLEFDNTYKDQESLASYKNVEQEHIEAPNDNIQIEQFANAIENVEGTKYTEWESMSIEEREYTIQEIENRVAKIACRPTCNVNFIPLKEGNYGYFSSETGEININSNYLTSSYNDYREAINTIIHEGRHAYQTYNVYYNQIHPDSEAVSNWDMNMNGYGYLDAETYGLELYSSQPIEADAFEFADKVTDRVLSEA